jgi:hypothetical protein
MRRALAAIAAAVLIAGCGAGKSHTATTSTQAAKPRGPQYVPSARHDHRPAGSVYDDEIGENILTARRDRVTQLFGQPASTKGNCVRYRIVKQPKQQWQFCFQGQKMTSASPVPAG